MKKQFAGIIIPRLNATQVLRRMNNQQANALHRLSLDLDCYAAQIASVKKAGQPVPADRQKEFDEMKETAINYLNTQFMFQFRPSQSWAKIKKIAKEKYPTIFDKREEPGARTK